MNLRNINIIETNAFVAEAFQTIHTLKIQNLQINILSRGALNGLSQLRTLIFQSSLIQGFENDVLKGVAKTLSYLSLEEPNTSSKPLLLDSLTGAEHMTALETLKFKYNLNNTISDRTFVGLPRVTTIDLSYCRIEVIGAYAFDAISATIEVLNLSGNQLKNFPSGLFDLMIPKYQLTINVFGNPWRCDCDLCYVKWLIKNDLNVISKPAVCNTPDFYGGYQISTTQFCTDVSCDTYEQPPTTPIPPTTVVNGNETTTQKVKCYKTAVSSISYEILNIQPRNYNFRIFPNSSNRINIAFDKAPINIFIIWFNSDMANDCLIGVNCRIDTLIDRSSTYNSFLGNLIDDSTYTFCQQTLLSTPISPLDCLSHFLSNSPNQWLSNGDQTLTISLIVVGCIFCIVLGLFLGYIVIRHYQLCGPGDKGACTIFNTDVNDGCKLEENIYST